MLRSSHHMSTITRNSQMSSGAFRRAYKRGLRVRRLSAYRHRAIQGMAMMSMALYLNASPMSPCSKAWNAR